MSKMMRKWYTFDKDKGSRQKRPPVKKDVVVQIKSRGIGLPTGFAVGYLKNAGGDKQSPHFIIPGIGGEVFAWCDCLPDDFDKDAIVQTRKYNEAAEAEKGE